MEEQDDYKERAATFIKEYGELVKKHEVDFSAYPQLVPKDGVFVTVINTTTVDMKNKPVPSGFVEKA
jgi:shikimate 5-dehydrogenase